MNIWLQYAYVHVLLSQSVIVASWVYLLCMHAVVNAHTRAAL